MADLMLGNQLGVASKDSADGSKLAEITADGVNTVTVATADLHKFYVGQPITFRVKATGAGFGTTSRTITGITSAGVITYDGADIAAVAGTHAIYDSNAAPYATSSVERGTRSNQNGGVSPSEGLSSPDFNTIQSMKDKLASLEAGTYTTARLNTMTENDLKYALRLKLFPNSV